MAAKTADLAGIGKFSFKIAKACSFTLTLTYPVGTNLSGEWQLGIFSDESFSTLSLLVPNDDITIVQNVMTILVETEQNTLPAGTYHFGIRRDIDTDFSKAEYKGTVTVEAFFAKQP